MTFLWPTMLWALLGVPLLVALYVWLLHRRKKTTRALRQPRRWCSEAMGRGGAWRRHVPPVLLLLAHRRAAVRHRRGRRR